MEKQKRNFATLGPVPVMAIADVYAQLEDQGWSVKQVVFSGMTQVSSISLPGQAGVVPVFMFICVKMLDENEKPETPKIRMPK